MHTVINGKFVHNTVLTFTTASTTGPLQCAQPHSGDLYDIG